MLVKMSNWNFTSKHATQKSINSIPPENFRQYRQFTPKVRYNMIPENTPRFSNNERHQREATMTVKQNYAGDTEIKFPAGNSSQLIRDTQKLLSRYFGNNHADDIKSSIQDGHHNSIIIDDTPIIHHSGAENNLSKSSSRTHPTQQKKIIPKSSPEISYTKSFTKGDTTESRKPDNKMIHLVGYVEHVIKWNEILVKTDVNVLYNVLGTFINIINGTYPMEKYIFIKGNNGVVLECSFFEVDRPFPKLARGQLVGCFGNIINTQKMRIYSVQILDESELDATQRVIFLSQRMVHDLNNRYV